MDINLSKIFKKVAIGGALMLAGGFLMEFPILSFFHNNAGGMALMASVDPYLQSFFNWSGATEAGSYLASAIGGGTQQMAADAGLQQVGNVMTFG
nr:hypothetical protein [Cytophagales bacterium]